MEGTRSNEHGISFTNLVIIGKCGTGKSAILNQIAKTSSSSPLPFAGLDTNDISKHGLELKTGAGRVMISKLSLSSPLNTACLLNTLRAHAYILVYGVDDYESFDFVQNVKDFIITHKGESASIIVVGNKSDIPSRTVLFEIADCTVSIEWELNYLETSAKTGDNISKILPTLLKYPPLEPLDKEDIETYEFKGSKIKRNTGSSKSMRTFRSSIMGNIFSRNKSRSMKDSTSSDEVKPPKRFGFSFLHRSSTKRSSSPAKENITAGGQTSRLAKFLDCVN